MSERGWREFLAAEGVDDWVVLHGGATAVFRVPSLGEAARRAEAIAQVAGLAESGALLSNAHGRHSVRVARGGVRREPVRKLAAALLAVVVVVAAAAAWVVTTEPDWYQRARYPLRYETIVRAHAKNYDLPPTLLAAVIYTESRFDADARSDAGAVGLMQLLPDTARGIAVRTGGDGFVESDLLDPEINVLHR